MAKTMPWRITNTSSDEYINSGHTKMWSCSVPGCMHWGTSKREQSAVYAAAVHTANHSEAQVAATGYAGRTDWVAFAAKRLRKIR